MGRSPPGGAEATYCRPSADLHTREFQKGTEMARRKSMAGVTRKGNRLEQLENLAVILAGQMDECSGMQDGARVLPQLAKQYRETIREIEEIKGMEEADDEIGEILSARKADGKPDAIR